MTDDGAYNADAAAKVVAEMRRQAAGQEPGQRPQTLYLADLIERLTRDAYRPHLSPAQSKIASAALESISMWEARHRTTARLPAVATTIKADAAHTLGYVKGALEHLLSQAPAAAE